MFWRVKAQALWAETWRCPITATPWGGPPAPCRPALGSAEACRPSGAGGAPPAGPAALLSDSCTCLPARGCEVRVLSECSPALCVHRNLCQGRASPLVPEEDGPVQERQRAELPHQVRARPGPPSLPPPLIFPQEGGCPPSCPPSLPLVCPMGQGRFPTVGHHPPQWACPAQWGLAHTVPSRSWRSRRPHSL